MKQQSGGRPGLALSLRDFGALNWLAAGLLVLGIGFGVWERWSAAASRSTIDAENGSLVVLQGLLSALKDLETGERGFALTGVDAYLQPYNQANAILDHALEQAITATQSSGAPDNLAALVQTKRDYAAKVIATRRQSGLDAATAMIMAGIDKTSMDSVRVAIADRATLARRIIGQVDRDQAMREPVLITISLACIIAAFATTALLALRRRRAERAGAALLASVLDNAPVGLGFLDGDMRVQHVNHTLAGMSEHVLDAAIGRSLWDVLPDMRDELEPRLQAALRAGRTLANVEVAVPSRVNLADLRHFLFGFFPLPITGDEAVSRAGLVVTDITSRTRAERRLRESEERFRTLIETSAAIVWTASPDGEFISRQPSWAAFTGQIEAEYTGFGWAQALHPDDREASVHAWKSAVAAHALFAADYRLRRADGQWRIMAVRGAPIMEDGVTREWVGTNYDITERKLAEEELSAARDAAEAANRAKSQFLANMSHELRTPLSAVIGYSEMLEEEMEETGEAHLLGDIRKIQTNARHLLSLINDVLDLSKIEADRMTTYAETFDVGTLVRDVASTVDTLVKQKGNTLVLELAPGLGMMHTDQVKLRQCLFNLVSNAAKFTEAGRIVLHASREGDTVTISIADSGIGMTEEQLERLFQRFSQADVSTTRRFGGTGLGLAITRAFCRLLGGDVTVTSVYGQGSTFTIQLPAELPQLGEPEDVAPDAEAHATQHLVLVVDDDQSQRDLLGRFLEREGFAVRTAPDGRAGLEIARVTRPRAILLDVMMPKMDGWSVLSALKADPELASIPVVMVTFVNEPGLGASLGAADLVLKPVEWDRLKQVMERFRGDAGDILVVDDDPDARARLRSALQRDGWVVTEAGNGREALEQVERAPPQLILLDLTMPVMDGFAFLHELRLRPGCENIPVVVLTARDLDASERKRLDSADRVLSKGQTDLRQLAGELRALTPGQP